MSATEVLYEEGTCPGEADVRKASGGGQMAGPVAEAAPFGAPLMALNALV